MQTAATDGESRCRGDLPAAEAAGTPGTGGTCLEGCLPALRRGPLARVSGPASTLLVPVCVDAQCGQDGMRFMVSCGEALWPPSGCSGAVVSVLSSAAASLQHSAAALVQRGRELYQNRQHTESNEQSCHRHAAQQTEALGLAAGVHAHVPGAPRTALDAEYGACLHEQGSPCDCLASAYACITILTAAVYHLCRQTLIRDQPCTTWLPRAVSSQPPSRHAQSGPSRQRSRDNAHAARDASAADVKRRCSDATPKPIQG
jgi:hypothetical protein